MFGLKELKGGIMEMKLEYVLIGLVVFAVLIGGWAMLAYNGIVGASQGVDSQWGNVNTVYQRRADLIPNLVSSVKGYMTYEGGLLANITALRSQWQNAKTTEDKIAAGSGMDSAISRLLMVTENYPNLKADASVSKLMDELAGSENRISVERMRYNDAVKEYNMKVLYFPGSIIANMFGFHQKPYFQAAAGAENVPQVKF